MSLVLQVVGTTASQLGAGGSKTFEGTGGSIGRASDNQWVIPGQYISSRHARIHYRDGKYFLEDTSSNGVYLGSRDTRLPKGQQHPLQNGDRFYIDEFEIAVTVHTPMAPLAPASVMGIPEDIFASNGSAVAAPLGLSAAQVETDPLKVLGLAGSAPRPTPGPRLEEVEGASPLRERVRIPGVHAPTPSNPPVAASGPAAGVQIPDDFNPFGGERLPPARPASAESARVRTAEHPRVPIPEDPGLLPEHGRVAPPSGSPRPRAGGSIAPGQPVSDPPVAAASASAAPRRSVPAAAAVPMASPDASPAQTGRQAQLDLIALLEAAGVPGSAATPGVARELGEILRIVVIGVMDVLSARDRIKEEFRIRHTTFKTTDNNPLKFSANVEDALHNLLVKRNPAYLGPVDAFEDGFADIRNHQMAMLAGMRVAYEAMLRRFDPERLQERFDEKGSRGALLPMPARMRYWDQFSEEYRELVKDPESGFRDLFGAEFTRAYEEQLLRLRTLSRSHKRGS